MTNVPKNCLMLVDGNAVFHRAFHALPDTMQTKSGQKTNAIYGFITTLLKAIKDLEPQYVAVAFDVKEPTFRHKMYAGYKAHRAETATELVDQIPFIHNVVEAFNLPLYTAPGFEADDIIGTLAEQARNENVPVVIVTGDNDSLQLVDDGKIMVYTMKRSLADTVLLDEAGTIEKFGVKPNQIVDYKALAGDSSDEIPGVAGIGAKTAATLLTAKPDLKSLLAAIDNNEKIDGVSATVIEKIKAHRADAELSYILATIRRDAPVKLDLEKSVLHDFDPKKLTELFKQLEFFSLISRLPQPVKGAQTALDFSDSSTNMAPAKRDWAYNTVKTESELKLLVEKLSSQTTITLDTETDDLHGPLIGLSFAVAENEGWYVPVVPEHGATLNRVEIMKALRPVLENPKIGKIGHNIKYDYKAIEKEGVVVAPIVFDTMIASYVLTAHLRNHDLDTLALREFGYQMISFSSLFPPKTKQPRLLNIAADTVAEYAAEDAIITHRLYKKLAQDLAKSKKLQTVFDDIDIPLIPVLAQMEENGVLVDAKALENLKHLLTKKVETLRTSVMSHAKNKELNLNSPAQLQIFLFEDLGLPKDAIKATKTGISTAAGELDKLKGLHPVVNQLLEYRELTKLLNTYVETLPNLIAKDGRIHAQFNQTIAATGRLSSSDPNMQNIPIHSELGNEIRKAFVAPKGWAILSLDYSQIELRIIAHITGDERLQAVFKSGRDIHAEVAKELGIDRRAAKAINFGIFYGLSAYGLSQSLGIDPKDAKKYIDNYLDSYPKVREYLKTVRETLKQQGYVETLFGRKREIPEIYSGNVMVRASAERMAVNMPAQGTQADLIKLAMIKTQNWINEMYTDPTAKPKMILQVHDELDFEVPESELKLVAAKIKQIMENVHKFDVPITAEAASGPSWGTLTPLA